MDHDADETTPQQDYRYLAGLPTDPNAFLDRISHERPSSDRSNCVFIMIDKLLRRVAVPPKLRATFCWVLAALPQIRIRKCATDLAVRPGHNDLH